MNVPSVLTTKVDSQRRKGRDKAIPTLEMAIDNLNIAQAAIKITPVNRVFSSVAMILTTIRVSSFPFYDGVYQAHT